MRIVVVEHPAIAKKLAPLLVARWPGERIAMMPLLRGYLSRPVYPRGLAYNDFPVTRPLKFKASVIKGSDFFTSLHCLAEDGSVSSERLSLEQARQVLESATSLAYMGDWDYKGAWGMEELKRHLLPGYEMVHEVYRFAPDYKIDGYPLEIPEPLCSLDASYLDLCQAAEVKRYFEYNFYLNCHAIMGKLYREVFSISPPEFIGRNGLMTSIRMAQEGILPKDLAGYLMEWTGTGRYQNEGRFYSGAGSFLSCFYVKFDLVRLEIAKDLDGAQGGFELTPRGALFVSRLHKDCYDPDLPFRLGEWMSKPLREVQGVMDQYIHTYFRKQKRLQDKKPA